MLDEQITTAGKKVLKKQHFWHLSDESVGLALFSDDVPIGKKRGD